MRIVGVCRFSLVGRGDWAAFRGADAEQEKAAIQEQAEKLFTPERMEARLKSFEQLTLASLKAQTDQDFAFIVLSSELMPKRYRRRLEELCSSVPQVTLRFLAPMATDHAQRKAFIELGFEYSDTLQFRLDDDDCLCAEFINLLRSGTVEAMNGDEIFAASVSGVIYSVLQGESAGIYNWPVDFMSAGAALRHPRKSIYKFGHFRMGKRFPAIIIPGGMALVTNNGTNDTNATLSLIARQGMTPMDGADVAITLRKHFPFLSLEALETAGIAPDRAVSTASIEEETDAEAEPIISPRWYSDLISGPNRKGFFVSDDLFALQHSFRGSKVLYVGFDSLGDVRSHDRNRDPWGYSFAEKNGWSSLGVLSYRPNWFRIPRLYDELTRLAQDGFFERFQKVIFSGTSMGGYAACAFSSLSPGSTVIAFSPQSTLDPATSDWDRRYPSGSAADWSGPYAEAGNELLRARRSWIIYDPSVEEDNRHAERLRGPTTTLLRARYADHFSAQYLRQTGVLSSFVRECISDEMTESRFYELYRAARNYRRYLTGLTQKVCLSPNLERRKRVAEILRRRNYPGLVNNIERSIFKMVST